MLRHLSKSYVTASPVFFAPNCSYRNAPVISKSVLDISKVKQHLKRWVTFQVPYSHSSMHLGLNSQGSTRSFSTKDPEHKLYRKAKESVRDTNNKAVGTKQISYPENVIKDLVELDQVVDDILKEKPPYITYHYVLADHKNSTLSAKEKYNLSRIALGFSDFISDEDICLVLDLTSLLQDKTFSSKQNKELLSLTLERIFGENELCIIGHSMKDGIVALKNDFGVETKRMLDMQIAYEVFIGNSRNSTVSDLLSVCETGRLDGNDKVHRWNHEIDMSVFLSQDYSTCQMYTKTFCRGINKFFQKFQNTQDFVVPEFDGLTFKQRLKIVQKATNARILNLETNENIQSDDNQQVFSKEVLDQIKTAKINTSIKIHIYDDLDSVLNLIPFRFRDRLYSNPSLSLSSDENIDDRLENLKDIVMEVGRRPYAFFGKQDRDWICNDETFLLSHSDIETLSLPLVDRFGPNNRAVLDGSLHRISCMRSKSGQIYSLTYRIGRAIVGQCDMIQDILFDVSNSLSPKPSILILGFPGTGKTTVIRDIVNSLSSQMFNVIVVDTSNEICGDGLILHPSVGMARRMMVPKLDNQADILVEAVQNHTPDVIVCDEIGRFSEVRATKTVKERGVRCIGSAHGNLRSLVENEELNGLIGGIKEVTLGDEQAREYQSKHNKAEFTKLVKQRIGKPLFDVIIELNPDTFSEWMVVKDVGSAVDEILIGNKYSAEIRKRDGKSAFFTKERITC